MAGSHQGFRAQAASCGGCLNPPADPRACRKSQGPPPGPSFPARRLAKRRCPRRPATPRDARSPESTGQYWVEGVRPNCVFVLLLFFPSAAFRQNHQNEEVLSGTPKLALTLFFLFRRNQTKLVGLRLVFRQSHQKKDNWVCLFFQFSCWVSVNAKNG